MAAERAAFAVGKRDVQVRLAGRDYSIQVENLGGAFHLDVFVLGFGRRRLHAMIRAFLDRADSRQQKAVLDILILNKGKNILDSGAEYFIL